MLQLLKIKVKTCNQQNKCTKKRNAATTNMLQAKTKRCNNTENMMQIVKKAANSLH